MQGNTRGNNPEYGARFFGVAEDVVHKSSEAKTHSPESDSVSGSQSAAGAKSMRKLRQRLDDCRGLPLHVADAFSRMLTLM